MKNQVSMGLTSTQASYAGGKRNRGFTLVELLVTMVVGSIVMAAIYSVYAGLTRSYTTQNVTADVQQAVRATIDIVAEDIMMAGLMDPWKEYSSTDLPQMITAGSKEIRFKTDRNKDGICDADFEDLTYRLDGTELKLRDNNSGLEQTFIENVINDRDDIKIPVFRYFRENTGDTPTNNDLFNDKDLIKGWGFEDPTDYLDVDYLSDIRTVEISIIVEEPAGREGTVQRTYSTRVRCRNAGL